MGKVLSCLDSKESTEPQQPCRKRMVIIGDGACGKSSLMTRMCTGNFVDVGYLPTVFDTEVVSVCTGKEVVDLTIFDTAGQEDYDRLRPFSYHDIDVALMCFNLTDTDTLVNIKEKWSPEVRYFCGDIPIILVGNKKDLRDKPETDSPVKSSSFSSSKMSFDSYGKRNRDNGDGNIDHDYNDDYNNHDRGVKSENGSVSCSSVTEIDKRLSCLIDSPVSNSNSAEERIKPCVKRSEGALIAKRIGAVAYFETSALYGDNVEELLVTTTKASVLGNKKSKKFTPMLDTLKNWTPLDENEGSKVCDDRKTSSDTKFSTDCR